MPIVAEAFKVINGTHTELNKFGENYTKEWDAKSKVEATQFLNSLTKFEFVIGMIALYGLLQPVAGITQKLVDAQLTFDAYQNEGRMRKNTDQKTPNRDTFLAAEIL